MQRGEMIEEFLAHQCDVSLYFSLLVGNITHFTTLDTPLGRDLYILFYGHFEVVVVGF